MKIALANDHAGLAVRQALLEELRLRGVEVLDFGTASPNSVDYPDCAAAACQAVTDGRAELAVLICGTGVGISIAANKIPGIRCALIYDDETARMSRLHNNANAAAFRGRGIDPALSRRLLGMWLDTDFSGEARHQRRIDKIQGLEQQK